MNRLLTALLMVLTITNAAIAQVGLIAHYPFNGSASDASGNGHNGIVYGATVTTGQWGSAYSFNGSSNYILTPADNMLDSFHSGTVSFWFQCTNPGQDGTILSYSTDGSMNSLFTFGIHLQKVLVQYKYPNLGYNPDVIGSTTLAANQWYHVAVVADGASLMKIYLNGQLEAAVLEKNETSADGSEWFADITGATSYDHFVSLGALRRGAQQEGFFSGKIDDVRFYDRALSQNEALLLFTDVQETATRAIPTNHALAQNYPNPFNPSTTIRYTLPVKTGVVLSVFSTTGQQVARLVSGEVEAGDHEVQFVASGLASGVYFYRLQAGSFVETKKLMLVR
jgi:hypothetical protein